MTTAAEITLPPPGADPVADAIEQPDRTPLHHRARIRPRHLPLEQHL